MNIYCDCETPAAEDGYCEICGGIPKPLEPEYHSDQDLINEEDDK